MSGIGPAMDMAGELARESSARPDPALASQGGGTRPNATDTAPVAAAARKDTVAPDAGEAPAPADASASSARSATADRSEAASEAPAPAGAASPADVSTAVTIAEPVTGTSALPAPAPATKLATTQAPARPVPSESPADAGSLGGTVLALLLVVGLILALGWLAKRMPGFGRGASSSGLRMVASLPIGPRERVVVIEVGQTQLLLGVGPGGTRTLHTLAEPLPEAGAGPAPQFAQLLAQHFGKKA